ncbi:MAG: PRC-barrel domain-containing protein [Candidatus Micrarchaeota archaeon]|nr:PRC-barrel domain-containing protein [Candidatus Micrarchaeota archaeon]
MVMISDLYSKHVMSLNGRMLGEVKGVLLNMENGEVSHLLLDNIDNLIRSKDVRADFFKNSVPYGRVKKISAMIVVSEKDHEVSQ